MVILEEDLLTVEPERIKEIPVAQTIIAGEVVYARAPGPSPG